jgi:hypothetical protein
MTTELEDSSSSAAVHNLTTKSAASGSKVTAGSDVPWIEKYRPLYLKDIVANNDTINRLQTIAKDGNMPHLLLTGPPGNSLFRVRKVMHLKFLQAPERQLRFCVWRGNCSMGISNL